MAGSVADSVWLRQASKRRGVPGCFDEWWGGGGVDLGRPEIKVEKNKSLQVAEPCGHGHT